MSALVSNSETTRLRVKQAYGRDSIVIHPPVTSVSSTEEEPSRRLPSSYALVVSRNKGYKNVTLALDAAKIAGIAVAVVGSGSEQYDSPEDRVFGLGRLSDAQLLWLYSHASVIVGSAHEDFGLTVLEAGLCGTPAATLNRGGVPGDGVSGSKRHIRARRIR
ncbi:glycosyltransferase [Okibacterium fritillariae]